MQTGHAGQTGLDRLPSLTHLVERLRTEREVLVEDNAAFERLTGRPWEGSA